MNRDENVLVGNVADLGLFGGFFFRDLRSRHPDVNLPEDYRILFKSLLFFKTC